MLIWMFFLVPVLFFWNLLKKRGEGVYSGGVLYIHTKWPGEQEKQRGLWRPKTREREIKIFMKICQFFKGVSSGRVYI